MLDIQYTFFDVNEPIDHEQEEAGTEYFSSFFLSFFSLKKKRKWSFFFKKKVRSFKA